MITKINVEKVHLLYDWVGDDLANIYPNVQSELWSGIFAKEKTLSARNSFPDSLLTIIVIAGHETSEMRFMRQLCQDLKLCFVWIQVHEESCSSFQKINLHTREEFDLHIIAKAGRWYEDAFYLESCRAVPKSESRIFFRLEWDELVTHELLSNIIKFSETNMNLMKKIAYAFPRIWIAKQDRYRYATMAKSLTLDYDFQPRLFRLSAVISGSHQIHSGGLNFRKVRNLQNLGRILHLAYVRESLKERVEKINCYERIKEGAGFSKLRYYLPESYPSNNWEILESNEEKLLLDWESSENQFNSP